MTLFENDETVFSARAWCGAAGPHPPALRLFEDRARLERLTAPFAEGAPAAPRPARPEVRRAGDYQLGDVLGVGGFGVVYRAVHEGRRTGAAVKIPHPELTDNPSVLARFDREIEAIRRLIHPNVVEILDVGRIEDGRPYFAMELLTGVSLEEHLRSRGRLSPDEALSILEPLASALSLAHARAVVHRDIKPSNVFLSDPAGRLRVVLLDFGIAKLLDATGPALTASHAVVGTLSCIAPEQLLGAPVDPRTDVYALGALLYTMLTGTPPFGSAPYATLRQLLIEGHVPRPSARARVSSAMEEVVLRAMSRTKEGRYPSAAALLEAARRAMARDPGSHSRAAAAPPRRALGVYIEVIADSATLDERFLADFESILPCAREALAEAGFSSAVEAGTSTLLVAPRADDRARDQEMRRGALSTVLSLHRRLEARSGRDPRVRVHLCVHEGEIVEDASGALVGGDLLELAAWVPERPAPGVFASAPVLADLGMIAEPGGPSAGALLCLAGADAKAPLDACAGALAVR